MTDLCMVLRAYNETEPVKSVVLGWPSAEVPGYTDESQVCALYTHARTLGVGVPSTLWIPNLRDLRTHCPVRGLRIAVIGRRKRPAGPE